MSKRKLHWVCLTLTIALTIGYLYFNTRGSANGDSISEQLAQEEQILLGICAAPEKLDRWLLQQTWYYDRAFTDLAGAFGQTSFSLYRKGGAFEAKHENQKEGLFCIDGRSLNVIYFKTRFVPSSIKFGDGSIASIGYGRKLKLLGDEVFQVETLTEKEMTINVRNTGEQYELYRKN